MRGFMDILELLDADLCVNLSSRQQGVAEHLLDIADVRTVLQHQRGQAPPHTLLRQIHRNKATTMQTRQMTLGL